MQKYRFLRLDSFRKHPTYMKIIFYFVGANLIVLALSFVLLYLLSSRTLLKEIGDHSESLLVNSSKNSIQLMEWSIDYANLSSIDPLLKVFALSDQYDDFDTYTVWQRMMDVKKANPSIDSVYLVNDYTKTVVDSRLGVSEMDSFYDQEILDGLRSRKFADRPNLLPRTIKLPLKQNEDKKVITMVRPYETGKSISAFVLNIDTNQVMTLLQNNSKYPETAVAVLNQSGELVFSTSNLPGSRVLEMARHSGKKKSGWELITSDRQDKQMMVYATVSIMGIEDWKFIEIIPTSVILSKIDFLRNISLIMFFSLFLASLGVIVLISKRVYSPIQELVRNVMQQHRAEKLGERKNTNEMEYLSGVFESQVEKINELTEHWRNNKILGREQYLRGLLGTRSPSVEEIRRNFDELGIDLPQENLSIAIFRIDRFVLFSSQYSEKDRRLLRFAMANIIQESLQAGDYPVQTVDMGNDHVAAVLSWEGGNAFAGFAEMLEETQRLVKQYLSVETTVAGGKRLESLSDLHEGYLETYELTQERFVLGHGSVILKESVCGAPSQMYHLPVDKERQLAQAIQKANTPATMEIFRSAIGSFYGRPYFECKMSLITLFMQIRRLMQEQFHHELSSTWGLTSIENQIIKLEILEDVVQWIEDLLVKSLEEIASARSLSKNAGLIEQIEQLIEVRLMDANLSSKLLADQLDLSVNYLRNLYRMETNRSITEAISERRLRMICEELIATDLPIEPIVQKYGFTSLNTFYTVFNKIYGVTPANYRKMHKKMKGK